MAEGYRRLNVFDYLFSPKCIPSGHSLNCYKSATVRNNIKLDMWRIQVESCPRSGNSTRTGILWKMKVKLQKNSVDQIFTGEKEKKLNFLPFSRLTCISQWNFSWSMGQFCGSAITHTLQKS